MIRVGILGAAGYTGGELIRLLINHPEAEIVFANSESNAGNKVYDVHEGLVGDTEQEFTSETITLYDTTVTERLLGEFAVQSVEPLAATGATKITV